MNAPGILLFLLLPTVLASGQAQETTKPQSLPAFPAPLLGSPDGNLFKNPNFENGTDGWELVAFQKNETMTVDQKELHNGKPTLRIDTASSGGFAFVRQEVGKPKTQYRLSGYIRTLNVEPIKRGAKDGTCLMVGFTANIHGGNTHAMQKTKPWTKVSVDFTSADKAPFVVGMGLGWYASNVKGTAWFSDLSLVEIGPNAKK